MTEKREVVAHLDWEIHDILEALLREMVDINSKLERIAISLEALSEKQGGGSER